MAFCVYVYWPLGTYLLKEVLYFQMTSSEGYFNCNEGLALLGYCIMTLKALGGGVDTKHFLSIPVIMCISDPEDN